MLALFFNVGVNSVLKDGLAVLKAIKLLKLVGELRIPVPLVNRNDKVISRR